MLGKCMLCVCVRVPKDNLFLAIILTRSKTSLGSVKKCKTSHLVFSFLSFGAVNGGGRIHTISYASDLYNTHTHHILYYLYVHTFTHIVYIETFNDIYNPRTM